MFSCTRLQIQCHLGRRPFLVVKPWLNSPTLPGVSQASRDFVSLGKTGSGSQRHCIHAPPSQVVATQQPQLAAALVLCSRSASTKTADSSSETKGSSGSAYRWDFGLYTGNLLPEWKKMFNKDTVSKDVVSAASIFCVAVPLNLAIAVASNVPPQIAMVTAAVSAIPACMFGGTTLAVTGPAAAMSVLIAQAVNQHGLAALPFITFTVGVMQVLSGVLNGGWIVKLTPLPCIAGFTTGVGVLIGTGQLPRLLALPPAGVDASALDIWAHVASHIMQADPLSLGIGMFTLAVVKIVPKLHSKAGGFATLAAVGAGTAASIGAKMAGMGAVKTVGVLPPLVLSELFRIPMATELVSMAPTIGLIYLLCSVETLLSCTAIDKMRPTSYRHDPSQELIGQGFGNLASGMFSGMPVTSVIARSTLNVVSDGQTRLASCIHAIAVLGGLAYLSPLISMVPAPALSAVLLNAASGMLWPPEAMHSIKVQKTDVMPYAATALGILSFGLAEGVVIGIATGLVFSGANWNRPETAWMSFEKTQSVGVNLDMYSTDMLVRMSKAEIIQLIRPGSAGAQLSCAQCDGEGVIMKVMSSWDVPDDNENEECPSCAGSGAVTNRKLLPCVWAVNGPLNYLSVFQIVRLIEAMQRESKEHRRHILDLQGCKSVDLTGGEELLMGLHDLRKDGVQTTLMNAPTQFESLLAAYKKMGEINAYTKSVQAGRRPSGMVSGSMLDAMDQHMPEGLVMPQMEGEAEDRKEFK